MNSSKVSTFKFMSYINFVITKISNIRRDSVCDSEFKFAYSYNFPRYLPLLLMLVCKTESLGKKSGEIVGGHGISNAS